MLDFRTSSLSESKRSLWNAEQLALGRDGWWWEKQEDRSACWWTVSASKHVCLIWSQHHVSHIRGGHRDLSQGSVCQIPKRSVAMWTHWPGSGSWITTHRLRGCTAGPGVCQQCELGRLCWHGSLAFRPGCLHTSCPGLDLCEGQGLPCCAWYPAVGKLLGLLKALLTLTQTLLLYWLKLLDILCL